MSLALVLGILAALSLLLTLWQWGEGGAFPLHRRHPPPASPPSVSLLKPLKGCDGETAACLRSWLSQDYAGRVQALFGVAEASDPAARVVREVLREFPQAGAQLVVCPAALGPNAKVSTLVQLYRQATGEVLAISDADVRVPADALTQFVAALQVSGAALVNPFYRLANPVNLAMDWEAVAVNADFWTSVLQARRFGPLRFALGAAMAVRREALARAGGLAPLLEYLADDYELGRRVAAAGGTVELCPVVVDCCEAPQSWGRVWRHQLRWARTIRGCQPVPYALSVLSNATLWPLLWLAAAPVRETALAVALCLGVRVLTAAHNQARLGGTGSSWRRALLAPGKDLLQAAVWAMAFLGNRVEWRGRAYRLDRSGRLEVEVS